MKKSFLRNLKFKDVLRTVLLIICGTVLGVNVYLINANRLVGNQIPMPFGVGAAVVLSGSMEPEFSKGDLIIVREESTYSEGDIVVFQHGSSLIVHRIIAIDGDSVTTKGDANNTADEPIDFSLIKGKVLFFIPYAGHVANFLKTPLGIVSVLAAAIALLEIPRIRERRRDDEDRQLILDEIERLKREKLEDNEKNN